MFALLTWQVAAHGPLRTLDERAGRALAASAVPGPLAEFFADLGNTVVALPLLLAAAGWAYWRGREPDGAAARRGWLPPLAALCALAVLPALVVPLKLWLGRPGPARMSGVHDGFYPSGHAATAAVAYGLTALLLIRAHRRPGRPAAGPVAAGPAWAAALLNVCVGVGLVCQGYHWPLDVLASWCLSGMLLALWCAVCDRRTTGRT
ncbi:phosphatase PAP2 family protein [Streptomyces pinistramenti]|uniref:phosphatase PAP2 family protein n=1 Tax=Streptomyces pinistramenti TaxID=2884812 RepID=UPI0027E46909|nr:phosphatase PAP2 family protein [Streptomyces pinistramenti]